GWAIGRSVGGAAVPGRRICAGEGAASAGMDAVGSHSGPAAGGSVPGAAAAQSPRSTCSAVSTVWRTAGAAARLAAGTPTAAFTASWTARWASPSRRKQTSAFVGWAMASHSARMVSRRRTHARDSPAGARPAVVLVEGMGERAAADVAPVHEERLDGARRAGGGRLPRKAGDAQPGALPGDRDHLPRRLLAVEGGDRVQQVAARGGKDRRALVVEADGDVAAREGNADEGVARLAELGAGRLEEFQAGGGVVEEVRDADRRPLRGADRFEGEDLAAGDLQAAALDLAAAAGDHRHAGD